MAIGAFFAPQQLLQLYWLSRFFRANTKGDKEALRYAPFYTLGESMRLARRVSLIFKANFNAP